MSGNINDNIENKLCIECNNSGRYNNRFDVALCKECLDTNDKYILLNKTVSKKEYLLTDSDLENLKTYNIKTKFCIGTYYSKYDILNTAAVKYNTIPDLVCDILKNIHIDNEKALALKREKRAENAVKRNAKEKIKQEKRKQILVEALTQAGIEFRNDSKLCQKYIDGEDINIDYIVLRMAQMKYLYEHCHMDECIDIAYKEQKEELKQYYTPMYTISERAEQIALQKYSNGKYPLTLLHKT
jgi:hypothetical protein